MHFSHRSLDQGFQKNLATGEPNEETRPEVKTPNPGKRRFKKNKDNKKNKDCTLKWSFLTINFFRASGEAILGTQRYFIPKRL